MLRADGFDEARLVAYARDELQKGGDDLTSIKRGRLTLWSPKRDPSVAGFFVDERTFVLGAGAWAARMADLVNNVNPGDSAATNLELVRLVERAAGKHTIWGAAIVPAETRRSLAMRPESHGGGDDQHALGRHRLRQGPGGPVDRRRGDPG